MYERGHRAGPHKTEPALLEPSPFEHCSNAVSARPCKVLVHAVRKPDNRCWQQNVTPMAYGTNVEKKLVSVGNSVALVLDKPLRETLGIKPTTLVRVMTDGRRLIIEPCGEKPAVVKRAEAISERTQAMRVAWDLLTRFSIPNDRFAQVCSGWGTCRRLKILYYKMWTESVDWEHITAGERSVVRRFEVLHAVLERTKGKWDEALAEALAKVPFNPDDPAERDAGANQFRSKVAES